tara:strand:- start:123 stop:281 length:159 start_codon:yes stop_codon:yes gene_type:complete
VDVESLKIGGLGLSGYIVQWIDVFSPIIELGYMVVLIAYFLYQIKKIKNEIK